MSNHYDVIVIGIGAMGSSASYHAAKRGLKTLGLDQYAPPHDRGSHSGQSRIIRQAYFEKPEYVPLLKKAYEHWKHIEQEANEQLYHKTGLLYIGKSSSRLISGVKNSSDQYNLGLEFSSAKDIAKKYPQIYFPKDVVGTHEDNAGYLLADQCINTLQRLAEKHGAELKKNTKVISWELRNDHIIVFGQKERFTTDKLVITAGAYGKGFLPYLRGKMNVTRQLLFWFDPRHPELFAADQFPCWNIEDEDYPGLFYGFPYQNNENEKRIPGLKVAYHYEGIPSNPANDNHSQNLNDDNDELAIIRSILSKYFPKGLGNLITAKHCYYTNTPDGDFIIDHLPNTDQRVIFGTGFSGHGFKFTSVIGSILLDLVIEGETAMPMEFLKLGRLQ